MNQNEQMRKKELMELLDQALSAAKNLTTAIEQALATAEAEKGV